MANPDDKGIIAVEQVEHGDVKLASDDPKIRAFRREEANTATEHEHSIGFFGACRKYPKAVAWSGIVSLCIIMDGYDNALMGSLFGFPAFQKYYGHPFGGQGKYQLNTKWQVALSMGNPVGNVFGVFLNGIFTDWFGHKPVALVSLAILTGLIFIQFFATSVEVLFAGQILCGIPWGIFSTLAPAYASEVAPLALRSYFETWVVSCWGIGQFISYAVIFTLNKRDDHWAFRIPFAVQWIWPVIIIPILIFCPESPWWYVRKQRFDEARSSIKRLMSKKSVETSVEEESENQLALMIETDKLEKAQNESASFISCFQGDNLWRTEIACFAWASQIWTGFVISGFSSYFFQQAGLSANNSYKMTLGMGGIHLSCNLISAIISGNYGRRRPYMIGCGAMVVLMVIIGILAAVGPSGTTFGFATSAVFMVWYAVWCLTLGPLPYVIVSEVSSTRLRSKTFVLSRGSYIVMNIVNSVVAPYLLNPESANWKGKVGFLTGGLTFFCMVWAYFRLPETMNRTFEEMDILFSRKTTNARNFGKAAIIREGMEVDVRYN